MIQEKNCVKLKLKSFTKTNFFPSSFSFFPPRLFKKDELRKKQNPLFTGGFCFCEIQIYYKFIPDTK